MSTYPEKLLGEILKLDIDSDPVQPDKAYTTAGIYSYGRGLFRRATILGAETKYRRYIRLHEGQFIYSKLFGWEGALAVVTKEFDGLYVSHEFPTFAVDQTVADLAYVRHLARWEGLHAKLRDQGTGMGSRRQRVNVNRLLSTAVPLPSLDEQRRIAARLDIAQYKLTKLAKARAQVDKLRQALKQSLINGTNHHKPLSYILTQSADYVNVNHNEIYKTAGIYSYGRGLFPRPPILGNETKYKKYNRIREGQFIYSKLFGWEGALTVVPPEFDGFYVSHEFPTFEIDEERASRQYVRHLARWPELHSQLVDKATGMGSRRQRVSPERLLSATIPLPSLEEQQRVAATLDTIENTTVRAAAQEEHAHSLRLALLHAGFNGEL